MMGFIKGQLLMKKETEGKIEVRNGYQKIKKIFFFTKKIMKGGKLKQDKEEVDGSCVS